MPTSVPPTQPARVMLSQPLGGHSTAKRSYSWVIRHATFLTTITMLISIYISNPFSEPPCSINRSEIVRNYNNGMYSDPIGIRGEWTWVGQNRSFDSPECCGWDPNNIGLCSIDNIRKYMSESKFSKMLHKGDPNNPTPVGGRACGCHIFQDEYEWQSSTLAPFEASETCRLLGNRTVLFVGDSTGQQVASTIINSFRPAGQNCQSQIYFAHSDVLNGILYGSMNRGGNWSQYVEKVEPNIVIVSTGAHIQSNNTVYLQVIDQILSEMSTLKEQKSSIKFAWQTQVPGGCTNKITAPQNATMAGEMSAKLNNYNYGSFYQRDLMLISRLRKIRMPFLDLRMLYSRTDAHINHQVGFKQDCLHMCIPGPLDVVARLFQKLLTDFEVES